MKKFLIIFILLLLNESSYSQDKQYYYSIAVQHANLDLKVKNKEFLNIISEHFKLDSLGYLGYRERISYSIPGRLNTKNICKLKYKEIIKYLGPPFDEEIIYRNNKKLLKIRYLTRLFKDENIEDIRSKKISAANIYFIFRNNKLIEVRHIHN